MQPTQPWMNIPSTTPPVPTPPPTHPRTREWSRLEGTETSVAITILGPRPKEVEGCLDDRSLGGIGVFVTRGDAFQIGQVVSVTYFASPVRAVVRRKDRLEDGRWRLGLEWDDGQPTDNESY